MESSTFAFRWGDLFLEIPLATGPKDIYLLSAVLHSFDNSMCVRALQKLREAIVGNGARVAVLNSGGTSRM